MLAQRIFHVTVGRPLLRGLVAPFTAVLLLALLADAQVDREAVAREISRAGAAEKTALFTGLFMAWGITVGRALRPIWQQPMIAFLIRQPMNRWKWIAGLAPSLGIAFVPPAAIWSLAPDHGAPVIHYLGFVGLAWPIFLGASFNFRESLAVLGTSCGVLATLVGAYWYFPAAAWLAAVVALAQAAYSVSMIPRQLDHSQDRPIARAHSPLAAAGPVGAMLRRDVRCLARMEGRSLLGLAVSVAAACWIMVALRVNGGITGRGAFMAGCILFSFPAAAGYGALERSRRWLGREFVRIRWPVTIGQRCVALVTLVTVLILPTGMAIAAVGASMGFGRFLLFTSFMAATITLCAALFARTLQSSGSAVPVLLLLLIPHTSIAVALPGSLYILVAALLVLGGAYSIHAGVRRFTAATEGQA